MKKTLNALLVAILLLFPLSASADMFKFWVAARGDYLDVSSDLFNNRDNVMCAGADIGVELFGVTAFGEVLWLDAEQFLFTLNLGVDFIFGDSVRFHVGGFTGPMFFLFQQTQAPSGTDLSVLTPTQQQILLTAGNFASLDQAEQALDLFGEEEEQLGRFAFGWNLARLRLGVDVGIAGPLYLGFAGQVGYHMLISGDDVAAGAKNEAIDQYLSQYGIPTELAQPLRDAVGAEPVDQDNLDGVNWDLNLYLRFEF